MGQSGVRCDRVATMIADSEYVGSSERMELFGGWFFRQSRVSPASVIAHTF